MGYLASANICDRTCLHFGTSEDHGIQLKTSQSKVPYGKADLVCAAEELSEHSLATKRDSVHSEGYRSGRTLGMYPMLRQLRDIFHLQWVLLSAHLPHDKTPVSENGRENVQNCGSSNSAVSCT